MAYPRCVQVFKAVFVVLLIWTVMYLGGVHRKLAPESSKRDDQVGLHVALGGPTEAAAAAGGAAACAPAKENNSKRKRSYANGSLVRVIEPSRPAPPQESRVQPRSQALLAARQCPRCCWHRWGARPTRRGWPARRLARRRHRSRRGSRCGCQHDMT